MQHRAIGHAEISARVAEDRSAADSAAHAPYDHGAIRLRKSIISRHAPASGGDHWHDLALTALGWRAHVIGSHSATAGSSVSQMMAQYYRARSSAKGREVLGLSRAQSLAGLRDTHPANLALHRARNGF
jgi:hypothetical protein